MSVKPEFSRPLRVDRVPDGGCEERLAADADECESLASRLGIPRVQALSAVLEVEPARGKGLRVHGKLAASIVQVCVVSLEEFASDMKVPVERYFLPRAAVPPSESGGEEEDLDFIENGEIDLGEIVAETLALSLDPYPRKPGVSFVPVSVEGATVPDGPKPFEELARLKDRPGGK